MIIQSYTNSCDNSGSIKSCREEFRIDYIISFYTPSKCLCFLWILTIKQSIIKRRFIVIWLNVFLIKSFCMMIRCKRSSNITWFIKDNLNHLCGNGIICSYHLNRNQESFFRVLMNLFWYKEKQRNIIFFYDIIQDSSRNINIAGIVKDNLKYVCSNRFICSFHLNRTRESFFGVLMNLL